MNYLCVFERRNGSNHFSENFQNERLSNITQRKIKLPLFLRIWKTVFCLGNNSISRWILVVGGLVQILDNACK